MRFRARGNLRGGGGSREVFAVLSAVTLNIDGALPSASRLGAQGARPIYNRKTYEPQIRINNRIRAREVRVILAATNEQLGVMKLQDALKKAQSLGLDLVEVAATANPPVCRIVDFGKYRYQLAKLEKDKKSSQGKLKEVKFRVKIAEHDYVTKVRRAEEFLDKGNKVKIQLQFRGREMAHKELGDVLMRKVKEDLSTMAQAEMEPRHMGRSINMILAPLPAAKRKRRFKPLTDEEIAAEEAREAEMRDEESED